MLTLKKLIYSLIFIFPLFFLPVFDDISGIDNYHKILFFFMVIPLLSFFYFLQRYRSGKISLEFKDLDIFILFFLLILFFADILGADRFSSFFGAYGYSGISFLSVLSVIFLYFFVTRYFKENDINIIVKILTASFGLIILWFLFILYNIGSGLVSWFEFSQGTFEDVSMLIVFFNVLILTVLVFGGAQKIFKKSWQIFLVRAVFAVSFLFLIFINFLPAWWCFLFGLVLILGFEFKLRPDASAIKFFNRYKHRILLMLLISVSIIFISFDLFSQSAISTKQKVAKKMELDIMNSLKIVKNLKGKELLIGAGEENFRYVFSRLRDPQMNNTPFWHIRFNQPASYIINIFISGGILGLLAYLSIFIIWFRGVLRFLNKNIKKDIFSFLITGIPFLVLFMAQFIYSFNMNLLFLFWMFLALNIVILNEHIFLNWHFWNLYKSKLFSGFKKFFIFIFGFIFIIWFIILIFFIKYYIADIYFNSGKQAAMNMALIMNPYRPQYNSAMAKNYLNAAMDDMKKVQDESSLESAKNNFQRSVDFAKRATDQLPDYVVPCETLAMIYRQIGEYSPAYNFLAVEMFRKASELEPSNPVIFLEMGKMLMDNDPQSALKFLERSRELKSDYFQTEFNLAKIYINLEREKEALEILEKLAADNTNVDVYYEMGRANYNMGEYQKAIDSLDQVIALSPIHANALYVLGLAHEKIGETSEALYFFKKVFQLNPDYKELEEKIQEMKK